MRSPRATKTSTTTTRCGRVPAKRVRSFRCWPSGPCLPTGRPRPRAAPGQCAHAGTAGWTVDGRGGDTISGQFSEGAEFPRGHLCDRKLGSRAPRDRQGRALARRSQPALRGDQPDHAHAPGSLRPTPQEVYDGLYVQRGDMENRIRSSNWPCSPIAPVATPSWPTSSACCGLRRPITRSGIGWTRKPRQARNLPLVPGVVMSNIRAPNRTHVGPAISRSRTG